MKAALRPKSCIVLASMALAIFATGCREGDGAPKASKTAYEVSSLAQVCVGLDELGIDLESVHDIYELRSAASDKIIPASELKGDYLLKTPYGNTYKYRFYRVGDERFVEVSAEVPDHVPTRWKAKMTKHIALSKPNGSGKADKSN
jgi:hypothetical protein